MRHVEDKNGILEVETVVLLTMYVEDEDKRGKT